MKKSKSTSSNQKKPDRDRTPREMLQDLFQDQEMNLTFEADLRRREQELEEVSPDCDCASRGFPAADNGSFYTQLGHAASLEELRFLLGT